MRSSSGIRNARKARSCGASGDSVRGWPRPAQTSVRMKWLPRWRRHARSWRLDPSGRRYLDRGTAVLKPLGTVGPILDLLAEKRYTFLYSEATLEEVVDVLARPRLRRRFPLRGRDLQTVMDLILSRGEAVEPR